MQVGDSIVKKARDIVEEAISLVEKNQSWAGQVLYGDTDRFLKIYENYNFERLLLRKWLQVRTLSFYFCSTINIFKFLFSSPLSLISSLFFRSYKIPSNLVMTTQ